MITKLNLMPLQKDNTNIFKNIQLALSKLKIDPLQINTIELCNQEYKQLQNIIPQLFNYLSNIQYIQLYNGSSQDIYDLLNVINAYNKNYLIVTLKYEFNNNTIKNIKQVLKLIKEILFNNIIVNIRVYNVISINKLNKLWDIDEYYLKIDHFQESIRFLHSNIYVDLYPSIEFEPIIEATVQDGKNFANLVEQEKILPYSEQFLKILKSSDAIHSCDELIKMFLQSNDIAVAVITKMKDYWFKMDELLIISDGTVLNCSNKNFTAIEKSPFINKFKQNLYNKTDEELQKMLNIFDQSNLSWNLMIEHIMINMLQLSKIGQIDKKYSNNNMLLFKHAFLALTMPQDYYSNLLSSSNIYLHNTGYFKFFFNGYMDLLENQYDRMLKNEL